MSGQQHIATKQQPMSSDMLVCIGYHLLTRRDCRRHNTHLDVKHLILQLLVHFDLLL